MTAARGSVEDIFYDPKRKDNILGRNKTRLELWEEHLRAPLLALDKALKWILIKADLWLEIFRGIGRHWSVAERAQAGGQRCGTNQCGKVFGFIWIRGTACVCAQSPRIGLSQRSMDRTVSSFVSC